MDLDGFVKLSDQQIKEETAGAEIATKLTQAEINWQAANKAALQNLSLLMNIQWDAQAHKKLQRLTNQKLQTVQKLLEKQKIVQRWTREVRPLISGPSSWTQVRDAWIAFVGLRGEVPTNVIGEAYKISSESPLIYSLNSWRHFNPKTNTIDSIPGSHVLSTDIGSLWLWAAARTYHPVIGSAAWQYMVDFLNEVNKGLELEVGKRQAQLELAKKESQEFLDKDFERLKVGPR